MSGENAPAPNRRDKIYAKLFARGTPATEDAVILTDKQVTVKVRSALMSDRDVEIAKKYTHVGRPEETESYYLRELSEVTGNPYDRGWFLKDKRIGLAKRQSKPVTNIREAFYALPVVNTSVSKTPDGAPFNYTSAKNGTINDIISGRAERSEEETGRAPKVLPFPLDRILEPVSCSYEHLLKVKAIMSESVKSGLFAKEEKALLKKHIKKVDIVLKYLTNSLMHDIERVEF